LDLATKEACMRWNSIRAAKPMIPILFLAASLGSAALFGCTPKEEPAQEAPQHSEASPDYLIATIAPTQGNTASGEVRFYKADQGVRVVANLAGLTPGKHGFHVHETGDCSAPDASSAGGHFNPAGSPHGAPDAGAAHRHAGDLGNIEADADGKAALDRVDPVLVFDDLEGHALLVHAGTDDLTSQPSGDAGPRVGCGVIGRP
jgi:Cu-Zn family superoxide dismutase